MGGQEPSVTDRGAVVVAGGAGALGSAIAEELLRRGRNVLVVDKVAPQDPAMPHVIADVTDRDAVQEELCARLGAMPAPEALIYAAGFIRHAGFLDLTPEDVTGHINVNLIGAVNVSQVVARQMLEAGGKILLLSSVHGSIGMPGRGSLFHFQGRHRRHGKGYGGRTRRSQHPGQRFGTRTGRQRHGRGYVRKGFVVPGHAGAARCPGGGSGPVCRQPGFG